MLETPAIRIPLSIEQVTAPWLNTVLAAEGLLDQVRVTNCEVTELKIQGLNSVVARALLSLDRESPQIPKSMVVKLRPKDDEDFKRCLELGIFHREIGFYRDLQPLPGAVPTCYHADIDSSGVFVLLLEDLGEARSNDDRGAAGPAQAQRDAINALKAIAQVHARYMCAAEVRNHPLFSSAGLHETMRAHIQKYAKVQETFAVTDTGRSLPADLSGFLKDWVNNYESLFGYEPRTPQTLTHGDFWPGQLFFSADQPEHVRIVDWQFAAFSSGARDVPRMVQDSLGFGIPLNQEPVMIQAYLDALETHGTQPFSPEDFESDYAFHLAGLWEHYVSVVVHGWVEENAFRPWVDTLVWASEKHRVIEHISEGFGW